MENTNNTGKIIGALLLGTAIGGILGVLFAPDKGSETRKKIGVKGEDISEAFSEKMSEIIASIHKAEENAKESVNQLIENGKLKA